MKIILINYELNIYWLKHKPIVIQLNSLIFLHYNMSTSKTQQQKLFDKGKHISFHLYINQRESKQIKKSKYMIPLKKWD